MGASLDGVIGFAGNQCDQRIVPIGVSSAVRVLGVSGAPNLSL